MGKAHRILREALMAGAVLPLGACGAGSAPAADPEGAAAISAQRSFFQALAERCGAEFSGRAILAPENDRTFRPAYLGMRIDSCTDERIRIPFLVDGDDSRTWVLTLDDEGLLFTHEHMLEGDTLSSSSGWGGRATAQGTGLFQHFPDHRWTPDSGPEAQRSVWRLRIDPQHGQFVYYLDRGVEPRYRLVFHMAQDPDLLGAR